MSLKGLPLHLKTICCIIKKATAYLIKQSLEFTNSERTPLKWREMGISPIFVT